MTSPSNEPRLVLASGSPRRQQLLADLGLDFLVRPADVDETPHPGEPPVEYVGRLAAAKARARAEPGEVVLAADTIVALGPRLLGKPADSGDARRMLRDLAGREHVVVTGVATYDPGSERLRRGVEISRVRFAPMTDAEIDWYAASDEPLDKAGAYAIQGLGALFVESLEGNYSNVVGLPLPLTYRLLTETGIEVLKPRKS